MIGLQSPPGPGGCDSESCSAEKERNAPPDVEPAGAVKFRIASETNGSPYQGRCGAASPGRVEGGAEFFQVVGVVLREHLAQFWEEQRVHFSAGSKAREKLGNHSLVCKYRRETQKCQRRENGTEKVAFATNDPGKLQSSLETDGVLLITGNSAMDKAKLTAVFNLGFRQGATDRETAGMVLSHTETPPPPAKIPSAPTSITVSIEQRAWQEGYSMGFTMGSSAAELAAAKNPKTSGLVGELAQEMVEMFGVFKRLSTFK